jgi:uncharacterized phage protein (TIGR02218 family)
MSTAYEDIERSAGEGQPVECYKFLGSFRTYRYTSAETEQVINGETYEPAPIQRGTVKAGTQSDDTLSLDVKLPFNTDVVRDYAYAESPPSLTVEVYRVHRQSDHATEWALYWKGKATSFTVEDWVATIRVPSIFARALQGDLPNVYWQAPCNHVLYDSRCKISRPAHTINTTVVAVGHTAFEVASDGGVDNALKAGEAVVIRTGERRLIMGNTAGTITINYPFVDLRDGDDVQLVDGCDHSYTTCGAKFANKINFGGHPYIPADNPFSGEIN